MDDFSRELRAFFAAQGAAGRAKASCASGAVADVSGVLGASGAVVAGGKAVGVAGAGSADVCAAAAVSKEGVSVAGLSGKSAECLSSVTGADVAGISGAAGVGAESVGGAECGSAAVEEVRMRRFMCVAAFDGTDFEGWQSQAGGNTVQDFIEYRLKSIFGHLVRIHGSGRTDAGVHARGLVFHFDAVWGHSPEALLRALRSGNSLVVQVLSIREVSGDFHARFSARGKRYVYKIAKGFAMPDLARYRWSLGGKALDVAAMREAAKLFLGERDFKAFSANRGKGARENTVKTIWRLDVDEIDGGSGLMITVEGSGFLYKMVRMIVGGLVQVGRGNVSPERLKEYLAAAERGNLIQAAPACGLCLDEVFYSDAPRGGEGFDNP